jgi:hypothetical protein
MTCSGVTFGQEQLKERLVGKAILSEIMQTVDAYYQEYPETQTRDRAEESDLLHWKRWEWYMSGRLGPEGEFVNIPEMLMHGVRATEKMEQTQSDEQRSINSNWIFIGPSTSPMLNQDATGNGIGRIDRIVFHPTNANIIFLCTPAGGLWNTLNGGTSWNNLTDYLPSIGISGFAITPSNPSVMYVLTGDGDSNREFGLVFNMGYMRTSIGVLKSTDGGIGWHATAPFPEISTPYVGYKLIQSPTNPDLLIAATSNGVYRTTNGGDTWVRELALLTYDVEFKPGDASRVYATTKGRFWISQTSGDTWQSSSSYDVNPNTCENGGGRIQIGVAPTNSNRVYLFY